jgi:hypothetical protein
VWVNLDVIPGIVVDEVLLAHNKLLGVLIPIFEQRGLRGDGVSELEYGRVVVYLQRGSSDPSDA